MRAVDGIVPDCPLWSVTNETAGITVTWSLFMCTGKGKPK